MRKQIYRRRRWTERDINYLLRNAHKGSRHNARALKRSENAVKKMAHRLNVSLMPPRARHTYICIQCRSRPVYTQSATAKKLELCAVCYERYRVELERDKNAIARLKTEGKRLNEDTRRQRKKLPIQNE